MGIEYPETGLYYYRARYYDSSIGRFLSEDLIPSAGTTSSFSYVGNRSINYVDPTGLIHQAWKEKPWDGRLHDDPGAGLEVLWRVAQTNVFIRNHFEGAPSSSPSFGDRVG